MRLMRSGASGQYCADDVLVERFAAAEAEPVPARVHGGEGGGCLGDHRGMHAEGGCGDAGAEVAGGLLAEGAEHIPDEGCLTLLRDPGLEVVGGHGACEAVLLGFGRQLEDLGRVELLQHRGVADLRLRLRGRGHGSILARPSRGALSGADCHMAADRSRAPSQRRAPPHPEAHARTGRLARLRDADARAHHHRTQERREAHHDAELADAARRDDRRRRVARRERPASGLVPEPRRRAAASR